VELQQGAFSFFLRPLLSSTTNLRVSSAVYVAEAQWPQEGHHPVPRGAKLGVHIGRWRVSVFSPCSLSSQTDSSYLSQDPTARTTPTLTISSRSSRRPPSSVRHRSPSCPSRLHLILFLLQTSARTSSTGLSRLSAVSLMVTRSARTPGRTLVRSSVHPFPYNP
jgi:hypothetical protein